MEFELLLFSVNPDFIVPAVAAGVNGIIVDWEYIGKSERQAGADTQINHDTLDDLARVRACTTAQVICRINQFGPYTRQEIEAVVSAGADELLLPMVERVEDVQQVLAWSHERCKVGILIETSAALNILEPLSQLPLQRVYVGLNDLAIQRHTPNLFTALIDGTLQNIRVHFSQRFGFGGLTLPGKGSPIPCNLLIAEMARMNCHFSFLRRSFHADMQGRELAREVPTIHAALQQAHLRAPKQVLAEQQALEHAIRAWHAQNRPVSIQAPTQ